MPELELDSIKLVILMVFGGVFAVFALYLMTRPPKNDSARLEIFGMKFEASSAGILVFLVGAVLLSLPLWVTEVPVGRDIAMPADSGDQPAQASQPPPEPNTETAPRAAVEVGPGEKAVILPATADSREVEPNDSVHVANQIPGGTTVRGRTSDDDPDWYVLDTSQSQGKQIDIGVRFISGGRDDYLNIMYFDQNEKNKSTAENIQSGAERKIFDIGDNKRFFVKIQPLILGKLEYEIFFDILESEF